MEDKLNVLAPEVAKVDEIDKNNLTVVSVSYTHLTLPTITGV